MAVIDSQRPEGPADSRQSKSLTSKKPSSKQPKPINLQFLTATDPKDFAKDTNRIIVRKQAIRHHLESVGAAKPRDKAGQWCRADSSQAASMSKDPANKPHHVSDPQVRKARGTSRQDPTQSTPGRVSLISNPNGRMSMIPGLQKYFSTYPLQGISPYVLGRLTDPFDSFPPAPLGDADSMRWQCVTGRSLLLHNEWWTEADKTSESANLACFFVAACFDELFQEVLESSTVSAVKGALIRSVYKDVEAGHITNITIASVLHLMCHEIYKGDLHATACHGHGLAHIAFLCGGLHEMAKTTKMVPFICYKYRMMRIVSETICCAEASGWHIAATGEEYKAESPIYFSGDKFEYLPTVPGCSARVLDLLDRLRSLSATVLDLAPGAKPELSVHRANYAKTIAEHSDGQETRDSVYEACRIVALIFYAAVLNQLPFSRVVKIAERDSGSTGLLRQLSTAIKDSDNSPIRGDMGGVFMFIGLIGSAASDPFSVPSKALPKEDIILRRWILSSCLNPGVWIDSKSAGGYLDAELNLLRIQRHLEAGRPRQAELSNGMAEDEIEKLTRKMILTKLDHHLIAQYAPVVHADALPCASGFGFPQLSNVKAH